MPISTETESLINLYTQKIELDQKQIEQVNATQEGYTIVTGIGSTDSIKIWGPSEVIDIYNGPIKKIDNKIVNINDQIGTLQYQVLVVSQEALSVGCGSTGWSPGFSTVTIYQDVLNYEGYTFTGSNPFNPIQGVLNSGNLGIGTYNYISQVAIGSYYGSISTCSGFTSPCFLNPQLCPGYASSISTLESQVLTLQIERNDLIAKVNFLKKAKINAELQNYAYEESKSRLNESIGVSNSILSFLQDPVNEEWL